MTHEVRSNFTKAVFWGTASAGITVGGCLIVGLVNNLNVRLVGLFFAVGGAVAFTATCSSCKKDQTADKINKLVINRDFSAEEEEALDRENKKPIIPTDFSFYTNIYI